MNRPPYATPMARAQAHLAAARYPQAIGAFRAVVGIAPTVLPARWGLADALVAQGRRDEAVEGLMTAAEDFTAREAYDDALGLIGRALALAPERLELHLDVAMVEEAMGDHGAALVRVEGLADSYMDAGRTDEAAELLRFVATWGEDEDEDEQEETTVEREAPAEVVREAASFGSVTWHEPIITGATVVARNPLLDAPEAPPPVVEAPPSIPQVPQPVLVEVPNASDTVVCLRFDSDEDCELVEQETTVARAPSAPIAVATEPEPDPDPDMVTRVADLRRLRSRARPPGPPPPPLPRPSNPMVERLRARAGLAAPSRSVPFRGTSPLSVRPPLRRPSRPDEEVTMRYRRPRRLAVG